jgi:hypothetical protein
VTDRVFSRPAGLISVLASRSPEAARLSACMAAADLGRTADCASAIRDMHDVAAGLTAAWPLARLASVQTRVLRRIRQVNRSSDRTRVRHL